MHLSNTHINLLPANMLVEEPLRRFVFGVFKITIVRGNNI